MTAAHLRAARIWHDRRRSELEAAARFETLACELGELGASVRVVDMARQAARDEHRHASLCDELVRHFGGEPCRERTVAFRRVAPRDLQAEERTLYEVVAMSCVTETLSTALLGELVGRATDSIARSTMHSILRDEVSHSRLGWAHLAEWHGRGGRDCVGAYLPQMLEATLGTDLLSPDREEDLLASELSGLGRVDIETSRRVATETLDRVIFPGLRRFGIDVAAGSAWLRAHAAAQIPEIAP